MSDLHTKPGLIERRRPLPDLRMPIKVFDFFSGCGGTSAGLRAAGMEIALGIDNDVDAALTFQANFPETVFLNADIRRLPTRALDNLVSDVDGSPLLFSACAPCQPFSKQRGVPLAPGDKRVGLLDQFLRFAKRYRPELLFIENVPRINDGDFLNWEFDRFTRTLEKLHYSIERRIFDSQSYGVPQKRSRLVLIASRLGPISFPAETHGPSAANPNYSTVREWIEDLPVIAAGEQHPNIPNHRASFLSPLNLIRIQSTPEGGGWRNWPVELVPSCHRNGFRGYSDVYGRMKWDAPATGLTTRCISYSNGRFGHPDQDRAISVREAACLQTFPRDFIFTGNLNSMAKQVGNAVPVLLAQRFGYNFRSHVAEIANSIYN